MGYQAPLVWNNLLLLKSMFAGSLLLCLPSARFCQGRHAASFGISRNQISFVNVIIIHWANHLASCMSSRLAGHVVGHCFVFRDFKFTFTAHTFETNDHWF